MYHPCMNRTVTRWVLLLAAFWVLGPVALMIMEGVRAPDGGPQASLLLAESPMRALAAAAAVFVIAGIAGVIGGRLFGVRTGFFSAGLVLVWPAWELGTVLGIVRREQSVSAFASLRLEGVLVALATIAAGFAIGRFSREAPAAPAGKPAIRAKFAAGDFMGPGAGLIAGAVAATACARTEMPGQAIAAAFAAGVLGALVAAMLSVHLRPAWVLAGLALLAFIGPASGAMIDGSQAVAHLYSGTITPLARLTPMHWAAGLMLGVPIGCSWAAGLIKRS